MVLTSCSDQRKAAGEPPALRNLAHDVRNCRAAFAIRAQFASNRTVRNGAAVLLTIVGVLAVPSSPSTQPLDGGDTYGPFLVSAADVRRDRSGAGILPGLVPLHQVRRRQSRQPPRHRG